MGPCVVRHAHKVAWPFSLLRQAAVRAKHVGRCAAAHPMRSALGGAVDDVRCVEAGVALGEIFDALTVGTGCADRPDGASFCEEGRIHCEHGYLSFAGRSALRLLALCTDYTEFRGALPRSRQNEDSAPRGLQACVLR